MKVGVFQFRGSGSIAGNHEAIMRGIESASQAKVRLLVFQECATCGYPPVETPSIGEIDFEMLALYLEEVKQLAQQHNMYIALGTIRRENSKYYNSIQLIDPNGEVIGNYDKRALWGWDLENFTEGETSGIYDIDGIKVSFRICFEVRFPEYFRELFISNVQLCFVSFCDVAEQESVERYDLIEAHLATRAMENIMSLISVNSISKYQTAPTAVIDLNGFTVHEAPENQEYLLTYDYDVPTIIGYGTEGRIQHSLKLLERDKNNQITK